MAKAQASGNGPARRAGRTRAAYIRTDRSEALRRRLLTAVRRPFVLATTLAALSLALGGCVGNDDPRPEAQAPSSTAPVTTQFSGADSSKFCGLLENYGRLFDQQISPTNDLSALPDLLRGVQATLVEATSVAPQEIKPDAALLAEAYRNEVAALEAVNFDFTKVSPDVLAKFDAPEVQAASTRLSDYSEEVCRSP